MASRKTLLEVTYHHDCDTGMYRIGEIDFGIHSEIDSYLKAYGRKGKEEIVQTLSYLIYETENRWRKQEDKEITNATIQQG